MINTWFISDTHFGHKNIIEYQKEERPFNTLEEMHEVIIERWNKVVNPKDKVYHLGDFAFGKKNIQIAERLNGHKRLVMGNHATYLASEYLPYFEKLYGAFHWGQCILTHIPVHPDMLGSRFFLNVHGHLHSKKVRTNNNWKIPGTVKVVNGEVILEDPEDINYFNVSCEQNNLTPIHADIILDRVNQINKE